MNQHMGHMYIKKLSIYKYALFVCSFVRRLDINEYMLVLEKEREITYLKE